MTPVIQSAGFYGQPSELMGRGALLGKAGEAPLRVLKRAAVGELDLLASDELQQDGAAVGVHLAGALERGDDLGGLLDALGVSDRKSVV